MPFGQRSLPGEHMGIDGVGLTFVRATLSSGGPLLPSVRQALRLLVRPAEV